MRLQSIAKRKQTTASPEKMPMNTESTRKNRSSRNTDCSRAFGERTAGGIVSFNSAPIPAPGCEVVPVLTLVALVLLGDQQQCQIGSSGTSARSRRLPFDIEDHIHGFFRQIRILP